MAGISDSLKQLPGRRLQRLHIVEILRSSLLNLILKSISGQTIDYPVCSPTNGLNSSLFSCSFSHLFGCSNGSTPGEVGDGKSVEAHMR